MKSFMGKVVTVVAGIMMVGSVAFAGNVNIDKDATQMQGDITWVQPHSGLSLGGGIQSSHINGYSYGSGHGTANTYQEQGDSYDQTSGYWNNWTNHNGSSLMTSSSDLSVGRGVGKARINADQAQGSITITGNSGPSEMGSFMAQGTRQDINGYAHRRANVSSNLYSGQTDNYTQIAEDGSGWAIHKGTATQEATLAETVSHGSGHVSNTAVQYGGTSTEYSVGGVNSMSSEQTAMSMDSNNARGYGYVRYNAGVNQEQTHSFEQYSANGRDGSWQYSSGSVTTGTGYGITP